MTITFKKTSVSGRYRVFINGCPAGQVDKEDSTSKTWWIYQCKRDIAVGQPQLNGENRRREWAVRNAVLDVLIRACDVREYFRL